jgi:hypothetical protein
MTNLRVILLENTPIVDRNGEWFHEPYDELSHTSSKKHDYLVTPWPCDGGLLLDHFSAHKPQYSRLPPTGLVHYRTYKSLSKFCFLKLKVYYIVDLNHIFVHFFVRWILITPNLRVVSTQAEMIITFSSYHLVMDLHFLC